MNQSVSLTKLTPTTIRTNDYSLRPAFLTLLFVVECFALSPFVRAVDPPPGGGYPGGNTALGDDALFSQPDGTESDSTAIGFQALYNNTLGGDENTAVGNSTLHSNTTGSGHTANGFWALYSNTTGEKNTAIGDFALVANTTGGSNTATGFETLEDNNTGFGNTANGFVALTFNTTGNENTAIGDRALAANTTGSFNTAIGFAALNGPVSGTGNIGVGKLAGAKLTTGNNNIDIGNQGVAGESNTIRIGGKKTHKNTFIAGISGVTVAGGVGVIIDTNGHLGTVTSSARYKEGILALKPVTFRYKHELDPDGILQFGLVAEQVAKVNPDLVARDEQGKPYTVRYEAVNAMLLNEFLKEHRKVEKQARKVEEQERKGQEQDATITELKSVVAQQRKEIHALTASMKEQAAQIQKVGEQLEASKPVPRLVLNEE